MIKGFVPTSPNQLWVSDITYIPLAGGDVCYLHLVTDAYSHKIVGWVLADSLRASATLEALRQAIDQAVEMTGSENLEGLIHHSDRGVQYCCDAYVEAPSAAWHCHQHDGRLQAHGQCRGGTYQWDN
ncbi:DDE-type integrase/transposase/recombinase [Parabacteroides distasonis]|nr:DDE-type integrase/transposase/recombinase [Parabacteroides distasonis]